MRIWFFLYCAIENKNKQIIHQCKWPKSWKVYMNHVWWEIEDIRLFITSAWMLARSLFLKGKISNWIAFIFISMITEIVWQCLSPFQGMWGQKRRTSKKRSFLHHQWLWYASDFTFFFSNFCNEIGQGEMVVCFSQRHYSWTQSQPEFDLFANSVCNHNTSSLLLLKLGQEKKKQL